MRKNLQYFALLAGAVFVSGIFVAQTAFAQDSATVRGESVILHGKTVFLIKNGQRHAFRTPEVFFSHGYSFEELRERLSQIYPCRKVLR